MYSIDDNFTTNFMSLLSVLPVMPLYYGGKTKFAPIQCSDLTDIIYNVVSKNIYSKIIECVKCDAVYRIKHDMSESHYRVAYCTFCGASLELEEELEQEDWDKEEVIEDW